MGEGNYTFEELKYLFEKSTGMSLNGFIDSHIEDRAYCLKLDGTVIDTWVEDHLEKDAVEAAMTHIDCSGSMDSDFCDDDHFGGEPNKKEPKHKFLRHKPE